MKNVLNCTGHDLKIPNIVDSNGIYVIDENGKRYLDLESGIWCTSLGHNHAGINAVINKQINAIMHTGFCYSSAIVDEAAKSILSVTELSDGQCVFLSSGSEAIELLRQISRQVTGQSKTLVLHDAYLGSYSSTISRDQNWHIIDWRDCTTCPDKKTCDPDCQKLRSIPNDVAKFVFEPGSASGFVRFPPKALVENLVKRVRQNEGLVLVNEVTTGVGRTGKWFGYQHYDITPDMISIGKGIGNGYPVSIAVISASVAKNLIGSGFKYGQSHQNDPLGAAVASEVIHSIQKNNLITKAEKMGKDFLAKLNKLVDGEIILAVRGRGLMFAIDLASEKIGNELFDALIEKGFIVCNRGALFRLDPPLTISEAEFRNFIDAFSEIIKPYKSWKRP